MATAPSQYRMLVSETMGQGTGFAIGWRRALQQESTLPRVAHDTVDFLAVLIPFKVFGRVLAVSPHLSPSHEYKQQKEALYRMSALAFVVRVDLDVMGRDYNMSQTSARDALAPSLRPSGCLCTFVSALLEGTITNITFGSGVFRYTSIDHILVRRHTRISNAATIPSPSSHSLLFAIIETDRHMPDVRSWKFVAWRRASELQITALSRVLDIVWGLMTFMLLPPNAYLRVMWHYAKHFIPTPMSSREVQAHMRRQGPRYTDLQLLSIASTVREAAQLPGYVSKAQVLSAASIT